MERREYLLLRGWTPGDEGWRNRRTKSDPHTEEAAFAAQRDVDEHHLEAFGSVLYWPTAAQAQCSPLCAGLAAAHRTEASMIEHLFRENQRLAADRARLLELQAPAPVALTGIDVAMVDAAKRAQAIADAWKGLAKARADMLRTPDATASPEVRDRIRAAKDALRALGVDPAEEETGR
jgi:hypothetical protein